MILERFVLKYFADTKQATTSVDELEKKSKKAGTNAGKGLGSGVNDGLKDAERNTAASVAKMEAMLGKLGKAGRGAGGFGVSLMAKIPNMGAIGGIGTLGTAAGVAGVALGAMALAVSAANKEAKKAEDMYKQAWASSRNLYNYNKQMVLGQRLGATEEQTQANMSGISQKAMGAINNPYSEQAYWIKRSGMGGDLKSLKKTGDIDQYTNAVMEHARAMAKSRNESQALAWATNRMGADFETTRRYIQLSDQQLKDMKKGLGEEAFARRLNQAQMDRYVNAQRNLESATGNVNRQLAGQVTPSLVRFTSKLTELASESGGLVSVIGELGSAVIDFGTWCLGVADDLIRTASGTNTKAALGDLETQYKIMGNFVKKGGELNDQQMKAMASQEKMYRDAAIKSGIPESKQNEQINKLRIEYGLPTVEKTEPEAPKVVAPEVVKGTKGESDTDKAAREKANEGFDKAQKAIEDMAKYDQEGAAALQKSLDELKKNSQDAAKDGTLKDFINTLSSQMGKISSVIESGDKNSALLQINDTNTAINNTTRTNETFKAQQEHTQPVRVVQMPPPIGLEQAMSLWAAGIGKAAGLKTSAETQRDMPTGEPPVTSGSIGSHGAPVPLSETMKATEVRGKSSSGIGAAEPAGSRSDWEKEARRQQQQKLSPTYQPNLLVGEDRMKQAIGTSANVGVSKMGAGAVNITQHNTSSPTIKVEGTDRSAANGVGDAVRGAWNEMTQEAKHAVNEFSDNWKA